MQKFSLDQVSKSMKKQILICVVLASHFLPGVSNAQQGNLPTVTLKANNLPLAEVLQNISRQTGFDFIYGDALVEGLIINCDFDQIDLELALVQLLGNFQLGFKINVKKQVILFEKEISETIQIAGLIVDSLTGETLPHANIRLVGSSLGTSSNSQGYFFLQDVPFQSDKLLVKYIGYSPQEVILDTAIDLQNVRIGLRQAAIPAQSITISAEDWQIFEIADEPSRLTISPYTFSNLPVIGDKDISRSLQLMPGIQSSHYGASGLHIRGGLPSQNLVLLDGMTLYHMDHSFGYFSAFNADAIKDVQVYKGGFPAKFGGRLSGVMELTAKNGDYSQPRLSFGSNQMSGQMILEAPLAGNGAILLSGRRTFSQYILNSLYDRVFNTLFHHVTPFQEFPDGLEIIPPTSSNQNIYFFDLISKITITPTPEDIVTFSYYSGRDKINNEESFEEEIEIDSTIFENVSESREEKSTWGNDGFSGKWYKQWQDNLNSTALFTYSKYFTRYSIFEEIPEALFDPEIAGEENFDESGIFNFQVNNDVEDMKIRLENQWQLNANHTSEFGLSFTRTRIKYSDRDDVWFEDQIIPDRFEQSEHADLFSLFFQDTWKLKPGVNLVFGLRSNIYDPTQRIYWEPRISYQHQISPLVSLKGAWGRYNQFVMQYGDNIQLYDGRVSWLLADGEFLQPGFAEHRIVGVQIENRDFLFDAEVYFNKMKNVIDNLYSPQFVETDTTAPEIIQSPGSAQGLELLLQKKTGLLNGWISYSYSKSTTDFQLNGLSYSKPTDWDNRHNLKWVGNFSYRNWQFSATWQYITGRPYSIPEIETIQENNTTLYIFTAPKIRNQKRYPASHRLDIGITRSFNSRIVKGEVGISVFNVFNRKNVWYRYFTIKNGALNPVDVYTFGATPTFSLRLKL